MSCGALLSGQSSLPSTGRIWKLVFVAEQPGACGPSDALRSMHSLPARAGIITVGNEGAFVMGGLAAAAAGLATQSASAFLSLCCMAAAGAAVGGLWIMAAGALQHYRGVNAVISSLAA